MSASANSGAERPLTARQLRFIAEYQLDGNATQAAIRAGYAPKNADVTGAQNLTKPRIRALIADGEAKRLEKVAASADWIVEKAVEVVNRALNAVPVLDSKGEPIPGEWTCDLKAATPALNLLAKRHREFSEKQETEHRGEIAVRVGGRLATREE